MGIVIPSSEEKLRLSGVPIGVMAGSHGGFDLVIEFMALSRPDKTIIQYDKKAQIGLSKEWFDKVEDVFVPGQEIVFDLELEKPDLQNPADVTMHKMLEGSGASLYKIVDCRHEPNPMTPYN